jgi:diadenosine tetraphosphate (Ap4A) HIT family hydrolase
MASAYETVKKEDILYEDEVGFAVLSRGTQGHIKVYSKKEVKKIEELDDNEIEHLFLIASYAATVVFETLGAEGTNVVAHSNNNHDHFYIDVIPRRGNDGIQLRWDSKPLPEPEVEDAFNRIKDKCDYIGLENKVEGTEIKKVEKKEEALEDEDSYYVKHLNRSP